MKKIKVLFLCAIMAIASIGVTHAAPVKVDSTSVSTTSTLSDSTLYADGKEVLKGIKTTGGDLVTNGYDIVVQQQRMLSYQYLFVGFLALVFAGLFIWFYTRINKEKPNSVIPAVLCGILMTWTTIVFSNHYSQVFQGLFNPDYAAIKDIVEMFKTGSGNTGSTTQMPK